MNTPVIQATDLAKTFRNGVIAVSGLDLAIQRGTVYGLIGRNGAGKTTSLRLLMGLLHPDRGRCRVLGHDLRLAGPEVRRRVAYVSQEQQLPSALSLRELCAQVSSFHERWDHELARKLATRFDLVPDVPLGTLSGGAQRKAALLLAFAACPEVLILDEPAAGLDPIARRQLVGQIVEHLGEGGERTVVFSTHIIEDIERVANQVGIMDRGRLVAGGNVEELQSGLRRVQIIFEGAGVPEGFRLNGALRTKVEGAVVTAVLDVSRPGYLEELRAMPGARVHDFPLGLQDLFIELLDRESTTPTLISHPL